jgi:hypothetical protein
MEIEKSCPEGGKEKEKERETEAKQKGPSARLRDLALS